MYPIVYAGDAMFDVDRAWLWWQFNFSAQKIITAKVYDDSALPDFNQAYIQYVTPDNVPPETDPLPIPEPNFDFADIVTTA